MYSIRVNRVQILENDVIKILVKIQSRQNPILVIFFDLTDHTMNHMS